MALDYWPLRNEAQIERNHKREVGTSQHGRCILCGANIRRPDNAVYVHEHYGGGTIVTEAEADALNAAGRGSEDLGGQPIGPECAKKHRKVLAPYLPR